MITGILKQPIFVLHQSQLSSSIFQSVLLFSVSQSSNPMLSLILPSFSYKHPTDRFKSHTYIAFEYCCAKLVSIFVGVYQCNSTIHLAHLILSVIIHCSNTSSQTKHLFF
eukprot:180556_1